MHGLYLLWWVGERGTSPATVAAVLAIGDVAVFLLEVPTGWAADRLGHRASLIVGSSLQAFGMLACWLGRGVPGLVCCELARRVRRRLQVRRRSSASLPHVCRPRSGRSLPND